MIEAAGIVVMTGLCAGAILLGLRLTRRPRGARAWAGALFFAGLALALVMTAALLGFVLVAGTALGDAYLAVVGTSLAAAPFALWPILRLATLWRKQAKPASRRGE